jgi:dolichol-phosphate mannosyltransferase
MSPRIETVSNIKGVPNYVVERFRSKENRILLVIPVINEGVRVIEQLKKIEALNPRVDIVIADGGSSDESRAYFHKCSGILTAVLTKDGSGKLSAQLRMGFHFAIMNGYQGVITMDGNNKDGVNGIEKIERALSIGFDFVQGSRFIKGGSSKNTPLLRYIAVRFIHAPLTSFGAKYYFTDTTNGFRGHSISLLKSPELNVFREIFDTYELLAFMPIAACRNNFLVCEVPVERSYPFGKKIPTKIIGVSSYFSLLKILIKAILGKYN